MTDGARGLRFSAVFWSAGNFAINVPIWVAWLLGACFRRVSSVDHEENSEEETHRYGQYDHVWKGDQEHFAGVGQWQTAYEHLLDEAVDASHDHEKGIGDEPEDGRWYYLADHQPIDDTEELHGFRLR